LIEQYWNYMLFGAGALFLVGPQLLSFLKFLLPPSAMKLPKIPLKKSSSSISYQGAMIALADVRKRLLATHEDGIPQDADSAIEVITHALVAGSDKP
tara:strand:+ start:1327 stop:1617 length:291 start_codon:yes stop_codon:yes gene_type:complete